MSRRLIPFVFVLYVANFLDRVNVSFAALQMNQALGFSGAVYGLGAGMFFLGYCLFQVPGNLMLERVGARRWIGAIMIGWGTIASAMILIRGPATFYMLRFLLGVVEAGFFPGIILYLTYWFPATERARAVGGFMTAIPVSRLVGGPLSGALLGLNGVAGLAGWQWLFLLEGLPSVVLGAVALRHLTDRPEAAMWLSPESRTWLTQRIRTEQTSNSKHQEPDRTPALRNNVVGVLALVWFLVIIGSTGEILWLPLIIKGASSLSPLAVGVLSMLPALGAIAAILLVAAHSDRTGERHWHVGLSLLVAAGGFVATAAAAASPVLVTVALSLVTIGLGGAAGPFWGLSTAALRGSSAAGAIAIVSAVGSAGGFVGPYVVGLIKDATGSFRDALAGFALLMLAAALLVLILRRPSVVARSLPAPGSS